MTLNPIQFNLKINFEYDFERIQKYFMDNYTIIGTYQH